MAIKYGKIIRKTWVGTDFRLLDRSAKLLLNYLWSCPDGGGCGPIFRIPAAKIADDLDYSLEETKAILEHLTLTGWIDYDWDAKIVWLPRQLNEVERPDNANVVKGIIAKADELPRNKFRTQFESDMTPFVEQFEKGFGTLPKWYRKQSRTPKPEPKPEPKPKNKTLLSGKPDDTPYDEIIADLNLVTGRDFQPDTKETRKLIRALCRRYTLDHFKVVHRWKFEKWGSDEKYKEFLRPSTLYQEAKFEGYLQDATSKLAEKKPTIAQLTGDYSGASERFAKEHGINGNISSDTGLSERTGGSVQPTSERRHVKRV